MIPEILFQSNHLVIINKPAGLPVHSGPRAAASVEDFFPLWRRGGDGPWLAHRLDTDTAGCLVIARRKSTLRLLQQAFAASHVRKIYWAVVHGVPSQDQDLIDLPLAKVSTPAGWRMVAGGGQRARTGWRRLGQAGTHAWLELKPETGRTHQLRAHCGAIGHPIVGDPVYAGESPPLHLLSRAVTLPLEPPVTAIAPPPPHMLQALEAFGYANGASSER